jgi:hypothetical protein
MTTPTINAVPNEVVEAALRAAEHLGRDVADVPLIAIAREAGMSRSTLGRGGWTPVAGHRCANARCRRRRR